MSLYAVVVPPPEEVEKLLESVGASVSHGSLTWEKAAAVRIGLCPFGNPTHADATRLAATLTSEIGQVEPFRIQFKGGSALDDEGDDKVWVGVGGDVDQLSALAFTIAEAARKEGFLVDRRWYRPRARLARINAVTTAPQLQDIVDRLEAYEGAAWNVTGVVLIEPRKTTDPSASQVFDAIETLPLVEQAGRTTARYSGLRVLKSG